MKIKIISHPITAIKNNLIIFPIRLATDVTLKELDKYFSKQITNSLKNKKFSFKPGSKIDLTLLQKNKSSELIKVRLTSLSSEAFKARPYSLDEWRKVGGDLIETAKCEKVSSLEIYLHSVEKKYQEKIIAALTEGTKLASYEYTKFKSKTAEKTNNSVLREITLVISTPITNSLHDTIFKSLTISAAALYARDLVNCPPSKMTPLDLVKQARSIAQKRGSRIKVKIYNKGQLIKMKAGSLLAVASASSQGPFLIHLSLSPKKQSRNVKRIAIIGKGITFDSGGLSIKPGQSMMEMKCDMAGAAAVLATIQAISSLKDHFNLKYELHVIIPTSDNMINNNAVKPGDVAFAMNGKSIEILNTDAEGRLILADAFCYAEKLKPHLIIDLATLTGACIAALGSDYAGLFTNNENLRKAIESAAKETNELVWPLPLAKEYREFINSPIADIRNIGTPGPGAITAALFLAEFIPKDTPWAHLDIAGPAFVSKGNEYVKKGGTGYGVRLLVNLLQRVESFL